MSNEIPFSHIDSEGRARMVDVSTKAVTRRTAGAACKVLLAPETVERLEHMPKGDAVAVARLAGIQAAKRVDELIPLAHTLNLDHVDISIKPVEGGVEIRSEVVVTARTGAELEAMMACSNAALALYDMVKAVERGAVITDLRLLAKSGGRSGVFTRDDGTDESCKPGGTS
jgi:cyclic pyranopterin phosphate synthase